MIITYICLAGSVRSQNITNELQVSAQASLLLTAPNSPRIFLTVQVVNTSDHEVTVLTRNLNEGIGGRPNEKLVLSMGYSGSAQYGEHPLIPSLYDFSPVTLRPNEAAFIKKEINYGLDALQKRSDLPLIFQYSIAPEWGKRFGVWSGSVQTAPFTATVRK